MEALGPQGPPAAEVRQAAHGRHGVHHGVELAEGHRAAVVRVEEAEDRLVLLTRSAQAEISPRERDLTLYIGRYT